MIVACHVSAALDRRRTCDGIAEVLELQEQGERADGLEYHKRNGT